MSKLLDQEEYTQICQKQLQTDIFEFLSVICETQLCEEAQHRHDEPMWQTPALIGSQHHLDLALYTNLLSNLLRGPPTMI